MIEVSRLPFAEWDRLHRLGDDPVPGFAQATAIVAQEGEEIVGKLYLVSPSHLEGIYIKPENRSQLLFKRLMDAAEREAASRGIEKVFCYAVNDQIADYLARISYRRLPWTVWEKEL